MKHLKVITIIHKAERQLLYERIRNISHTLYMYELKRLECYYQLKNAIPDRDISQCSLLINKINKFRHNRPKSRQKDKFNRLSNKIEGYMFSNHGFSTFSRHMFFGGHSNNRTTVSNTNSNPIASTIITTAVAPTTPASSKWILNLSSTPHLSTRNSSSQGTKFCSSSKMPSPI